MLKYLRVERKLEIIDSNSNRRYGSFVPITKLEI